MTELEKAIGYQFKDKSLLDRALTHSSYANEVLREYKDNERLEFLGDSVLGLITAEYLFSRHEDFHEGELSKLRSYVAANRLYLRDGAIRRTKNPSPSEPANHR